MRNIRSDEAFELFSAKAKAMCTANEFDVPHCNNILDTILKFLGDSYFASLDKMLSALRERFENFFEVVLLFNKPSHFFDKDIEAKVTAIGKTFENDLSIPPSDLFVEDDMFRNMIKDIGIDPEDVPNPRCIYQFVVCSEMKQSFPNIATVYKICLTIPVSSVSAERSFSCVKRLKSYLRSTMGQERLSS